MKDIMQIPLPKTTDKEVVDYIRRLREVIRENQRDIDTLKKQVARK